MRIRDGYVFGALAAITFGVSAPIAKALLHWASPVALAGVLYLSAGLALGLWRLVVPAADARLRRSDVPALAGVVVCGGCVGPVLMLQGLALVPGAAGALLLNLEAPFTMLVAVLVFREHLSRGAWLGAAAIVGGGLLLSATGGELGAGAGGVLLIAGACAAWAIDNNLSQRLSVRDPITIVAVKASSAGAGNLALAALLDQTYPSGLALVSAALLGVVAYGASIVFDMYALRAIGASREAAIFATAPFVGATTAVLFFGAELRAVDLAAGALMALGVAMLARERHEHMHTHEPLEHEHLHSHDEHHRHAHPGPVSEPHSHPHSHERITHSHRHVSDVHHRHRH